MVGNHLTIFAPYNLLIFSYLLKFFYQLLSPAHLIYLPALYSKSTTITPVLSSAGTRRQYTFQTTGVFDYRAIQVWRD